MNTSIFLRKITLIFNLFVFSMMTVFSKNGPCIGENRDDFHNAPSESKTYTSNRLVYNDQYDMHIVFRKMLNDIDYLKKNNKCTHYLTFKDYDDIQAQEILNGDDEKSGPDKFPPHRSRLIYGIQNAFKEFNKREILVVLATFRAFGRSIVNDNIKGPLGGHDSFKKRVLHYWKTNDSRELTQSEAESLRDMAETYIDEQEITYLNNRTKVAHNSSPNDLSDHDRESMYKHYFMNPTIHFEGQFLEQARDLLPLYEENQQINSTLAKKLGKNIRKKFEVKGTIIKKNKKYKYAVLSQDGNEFTPGETKFPYDSEDSKDDNQPVRQYTAGVVGGNMLFTGAPEIGKGVAMLEFMMPLLEENESNIICVQFVDDKEKNIRLVRDYISKSSYGNRIKLFTYQIQIDDLERWQKDVVDSKKFENYKIKKMVGNLP